MSTFTSNSITYIFESTTNFRVEFVNNYFNETDIQMNLKTVKTGEAAFVLHAR